jgi:cold shock CspA family protein
VAQGMVRSFDADAGVGQIESDASENGIFFNFTAIPGEGYRTIRPGTPVRFELIENEAGPTARNIQKRG